MGPQSSPTHAQTVVHKEENGWEIQSIEKKRKIVPLSIYD